MQGMFLNQGMKCQVHHEMHDLLCEGKYPLLQETHSGCRSQHQGLAQLLGRTSWNRANSGVTAPPNRSVLFS